MNIFNWKATEEQGNAAKARVREAFPDAYCCREGTDDWEVFAYIDGDWLIIGSGTTFDMAWVDALLFLL